MPVFFIVKSFGRLVGGSYDVNSDGESGPFPSLLAAEEEAKNLILRAAQRFDTGELEGTTVDEALADIRRNKVALLEGETQFYGFEIQER